MKTDGGGESATQEEEEEYGKPLGPPGVHFLNQIHEWGFLGGAKGDRAAITKGQTRRMRLSIVCQLGELRDIDIRDDTFSARVRLFMLWHPDDALLTAEQRSFWHTLLDNIRQRGGRGRAGHDQITKLDAAEQAEVEATMPMPDVFFFNAQECEVIDPPTIRIFESRGGAMLYNCAYKCKFKEHFELEKFPFDRQDLQIELRLDDPKSWELFDLTVITVQFGRNALKLPEWDSFEPVVRRVEGSETRASVVQLQVVRKSYFFLTSIIGIVLMLSSLSLVLFSLPVEALMDRLTVILTLLLTEITFKFIIAETIPKIGHSTLLDRFVILHLVYLCLVAALCTADKHLEAMCTTREARCMVQAPPRWSRPFSISALLPLSLARTAALPPECAAQDTVALLCSSGVAQGLVTWQITLLIFVMGNLWWVAIVLLARREDRPYTNPLPEQPPDTKEWIGVHFCRPEFLPPLTETYPHVKRRCDRYTESPGTRCGVASM